jgi:hypothetical protein
VSAVTLSPGTYIESGEKVMTENKIGLAVLFLVAELPD